MSAASLNARDRSKVKEVVGTEIIDFTTRQRNLGYNLAPEPAWIPGSNIRPGMEVETDCALREDRSQQEIEICSGSGTKSNGALCGD